MSFLLDTNVVSEWVKPAPNAGVIEWLGEVDEDAVFLSVVTLAELRRGVERLPAGARRARLDAWLEDDIPARFIGRILPVDRAVAERWGRLTAAREAGGRPMLTMDGFLAATAEANGLALVTRNARDFEGLAVRIVNPWT